MGKSRKTLEGQESFVTNRKPISRGVLFVLGGEYLNLGGGRLRRLKKKDSKEGVCIMIRGRERIMPSSIIKVNTREALQNRGWGNDYPKRLTTVP